MDDDNGVDWLRKWTEEESQDIEKQEMKEEEDSEEDGDCDMSNVEEEDSDREHDLALRSSNEKHNSAPYDKSQKEETAPIETQQPKEKPYREVDESHAYKERMYRDVVERAEVATDGQPYSCTFACKMCDFTCLGLYRLHTHLQKKRHGFLSQSKYEAIKYLEKAFSHVCKVCGKKELHEVQIMRMHLGNHGITTRAYEQGNMNDSSQLPDIALRGRDRYLKLSENLKIVQKAEISENTDDNCTFACPKCEHTTKRAASLRQHFQVTEHGPRELAKYDLTKYFKKAVCHICRICDERILSERGRLSNHMMKRHSLTLPEYNVKFDIDTKVLGKTVRIQKSPQLETVLSKAEICDDLETMCTYKCQECDFGGKRMAQLKKHFQDTTHGPSIISKHNYIDFVDKAVCHKCRICSTNLLCDFTYISNHLAIKHKAAISNYRIKYLGQENVSTMQEKQEGKSLLEKRLQSAEISEEASPGLCVFSCLYCDYSTKASESLRRHFRDGKHGKKTVSQAELVKCMTKVVCYICHICAKRVLCNNQHINNHFNVAHKITLTEYRALFKAKVVLKDNETGMEKKVLSESVGSLCKFACSKCKIQFNSVSGLRKHIKTCLRISSLLLKDVMSKFITHKVFHTCRLCYKQVLCDNTFLKNHFEDNHSISSVKEYSEKTRCELAKSDDVLIKESADMTQTTGKMENLCEFQCPACGLKVSTWKNMLNHFKATNHGGNGRKHVCTKYAVTLKWHKCQICQERMLCDMFFIRDHANKTHKLPIDEYRGMAGLATRKETVELYNKTLEELVAGTKPCSKQTGFVLESKTFDGQATLNLANLCKFECRDCSSEFTSWKTLETHGSQKHVSFQGSVDLVKKWVFHKCQKCPKVVLCDLYLIERHVKGSHKMSFGDYKVLVERRGGKILPTLQMYMKQQVFNKTSS